MVAFKIIRIKPVNIKYAIIEESILRLKVICLSEIARLGQMGSVKVRLISFIRVSVRLYVGERILLLKLPLASLEIPSRVNDLPRTSRTQRSKVSRTIETRIINYSFFILDNFDYLLAHHPSRLATSIPNNISFRFWFPW